MAAHVVYSKEQHPCSPIQPAGTDVQEGPTPDLRGAGLLHRRGRLCACGGPKLGETGLLHSGRVLK